MKEKLRSLGLTLTAVAVAILIAAAVTSLVLLVTGHSPVDAIKAMWDYGNLPDSKVSILDNATIYYLSAVAVAIGFRMNLFNIGVDGQYRMAAMLAAAFGGAVVLPKGIHQIAIIIVAMLVGAAWAGIVAILKVTRGVSEVISSIMLNGIATGLIAYLIRPSILGKQVSANNITTTPIPASGHVGALSLVPGADTKVYGLIVLAVVVGVAFQVTVSRTRFGFDLRATGRSSSAAQASGVNVKRMIVISMLLSGAVAGLIGMPVLLGDSFAYSSITFQSGLGFTGIAVALLGRNNPIGIAFAALLWAFLDQSSLALDIISIPKEIVQITQGVVVLSVVIAFELVRRIALANQQRAVGRALAPPSSPAPPSAPTPEAVTV
ncbi:simple sugar transport system permease protein [Jatrophihabitans sp. GAS493]|uniref:ABC transporter permease n=1 Tax=Jatrophihabitans sp. GAS493 TaxID=1907575 RepID=UPI000BB88159|nr:ABC transporter permease [Jatrophihabitans sp. GAS493]SOD71979.1 simple sugar transport system permease protein [Jatrophihabitans sp. GAS493]